MPEAIKRTKAFGSDWKTMILRSAKIFRMIASEMGEAPVEGLLDRTHSASFDLNVFRDAMQRAGDSRVLAQHE